MTGRRTRFPYWSAEIRQSNYLYFDWKQNNTSHDNFFYLKKNAALGCCKINSSCIKTQICSFSLSFLLTNEIIKYVQLQANCVSLKMKTQVKHLAFDHALKNMCTVKSSNISNHLFSLNYQHTWHFYSIQRLRENSCLSPTVQHTLEILEILHATSNNHKLQEKPKIIIDCFTSILSKVIFFCYFNLFFEASRFCDTFNTCNTFYIEHT